MKEGIGAGAVVRRGPTGKFEAIQDEVAIEAPLELRVGGESLAVTMRTPGHDEELAAGFFLAEGLVQTRDDFCGSSFVQENVLDIALAQTPKLEKQKRYGTISSSCGLCGKTNLDSIRSQFPPLSQPRATITEAELLSLPEKLRAAQGNFARTGGLHAAGILELTSNEMKIVREDIGRHNAVDKAIGRAFLDRATPLSGHVLMVSGRASLEIVQKALAAGISIVAAVSAPSSLAINFARAASQMLIGFLRPPTFNIYAHAERLRVEV